jgi:hypothetical protein
MTKHIWEKIEIELLAQNKYTDPYNDVDVWVELKGPGFDKRVYGFWDGGDSYKVRILATAEGGWSWVSGSNRDDAGLNNLSGSFTAVSWTEDEKIENPNRRGFVRPTSNGHALEYADGTPFLYIADTWWSIPSWRFIWYDDDNPRPFDETMGFKDMVQYRKKQGYNGVTIMASLHNWVNDGLPHRLVIDDEKKTLLRGAWVDPETGSPKTMHNEGGMPFEFPGIIPGYENSYPDVRKVNPEYFKYLDRKINYLNDNGFISFIETVRRDSVPAWFNYYDWPNSFVRFTNYMFARYHADNTILSPIHFDTAHDSIHPREFNSVINMAFEKQGAPPFGTIVSTNAGPSTLSHFGDEDEAPWLTMHQIGNMREHEYYWYLTEIFNAKKAKPALHGEPYYSAWGINVEYYPVRAQPNTDDDNRYVRNGIYGSFLSGGFAGYIYGSTGLVRGEREKGCLPGQKPYSHWMWDALLWSSAEMVKPFVKFAFSEGKKYQELIPDCNFVTPNKTHDYNGFDGWAYCAITPKKDLVMIYYEKGCPAFRLRSVLHDGIYKATWFNPRDGEWTDAGTILADPMERILKLPDKPTEDDWCLKLVLTGQQDMVHGYLNRTIDTRLNVRPI